MVCTACGDLGHNVRTCPLMHGDSAPGGNDDANKRGQRESPRTPAGEAAKIAKLQSISTRLSPSAERVPPMPGVAKSSMGADAAMPPLPGQGAASQSAGTAGGEGVAVESGVTMDAIGKLLRSEMEPMKQSMANLESNLGNLRQTVDVRLKKFEARMDMAELRVSKLESNCDDSTEKLTEQLHDLERQLEALKVGASGKEGKVDERGCTAVIGGLQGLSSLEEASTWVQDKLWSLWAPCPAEVFLQGRVQGPHLPEIQIET